MLFRSILASESDIMTTPDQRYSYYEFDPTDREELRYDIIIGTSCFSDLLNDYYQDSTVTFDNLSSCGVKPCFLAFATKEDDDRSALLQIRHELEDRLQNEILGLKHSGAETGIVIGGAIGTRTVYIDLLLYDGLSSIDRIKTLLSQYPHKFYLSDFLPNSELIELFSPQ